MTAEIMHFEPDTAICDNLVNVMHSMCSHGQVVVPLTKVDLH